MVKKRLSHEDIKKLQNYSINFGSEECKIKTGLLKILSKKETSRAKLMDKYQHILLFLAAYPDSTEVLSLANAELIRLNDLSDRLLKQAKDTKQDTFSGTGLSSSYFIGSFSHDICKWLYHSFPECISFHSYGESERSAQELFGLSLLPSESWLLENQDIPLNKWMSAAGVKNKKKSLGWILNTMNLQELPHRFRDLIFDSLQAYILFTIRDPHNSIALLRSPRGEYFYHPDKLIKKINIQDILKKNIPGKLKLSKQDTEDYIRTARFALLHLSRETDPVSYCHPEGVEVFDLDRGISIALFYLPPDRRNALDSYVGYMIYKNRIPCAYGGAWMFGNKGKIGLNIFPGFRGGESAFLFSQILRLYKKRYGLKYFEAEPYQIGLNNQEGIASGAFWFYYKLGFRPHQEDLRKLANDEFVKISISKTYRTSSTILKKLACSFMFLDTNKPGESIQTYIPDSIKVSKVISSIIAQSFSGDRSNALDFFRKEVRKKTGIHSGNLKSRAEKQALESLLPLLYLLLGKSKSGKKEQEILLSLIISKTENTELNFIKASRLIQNQLTKVLLKPEMQS